MYKAMRKLLFTVLSLVISEYGGAQPYLNNVGGTYKKVTDYTEIKDKDILIFASHSTQNDKDEVRIMTTVSAETTGYFDYYTYNTYDAAKGMPTTITLSKVNSDGLPYEYAVNFTKSASTAQFLSLRDINGMYIAESGTSPKSMCLSGTENKKSSVRKKNNANYVIFDTGDYSLYCMNTTNINGYFTNYNTKPNNSNDVDIYRKVHEVSFGETGYSTFYYGSNDATLPSGVKAYTYQLSNGVLTYSHEFDGDKGDVVPHSTAVILHGTPNSTAIIDVRNTQTANTYTNVLRGTDVNATTKQEGDAEGSMYYMLYNGSKGLGFYYANDNGEAFTNTAHKAYLCLPSDEVATGFSFILPDGTITDVRSCKEVKADSPHDAFSGGYYDLFGRRVSQPSKGVYIHNGKAISVK